MSDTHPGVAAEAKAAATEFLAGFKTFREETARRMAEMGRAIEAIGKPGVRWLIPALDDKNCTVWTAEMLKQITGAKPRDDKRKTWEAWYRSNRKSLEGN